MGDDPAPEWFEMSVDPPSSVEMKLKDFERIDIGPDDLPEETRVKVMSSVSLPPSFFGRAV